jgi:hypothetical protein
MKAGGKGFLISISEIKINQVFKRLGRLLTSTHVFMDSFTDKATSNTLICSLNGIKDNSHFLKEFTS